jgi:hypothetical protein
MPFTPGILSGAAAAPSTNPIQQFGKGIADSVQKSIRARGTDSDNRKYDR